MLYLPLNYPYMQCSPLTVRKVKSQGRKEGILWWVTQDQSPSQAWEKYASNLRSLLLKQCSQEKLNIEIDEKQPTVLCQIY